MGKTLEFDPSNPKQAEAMIKWADSVTEEILFGGSKNVGKSYLGASAIFGNALIYPDTRYFIARATLNDLIKQTTATISKVFQDWKLDFSRYAPFNAQRNMFMLPNKSEVHYLSCEFMPSDPMFEKFGSYQYTQGWIEEGGEVDGNAKTHLGLSLGRWNNDKYGLKRKLLITCNPKKNWMKDQFIDPFFAGTLPESKSVILGNVYDNKRRESGSAENLEQLEGVDRERLLLGNWNYDDDEDALILPERIVNMFTNTFVEEGENYITADIARFGSDKTVIMVWSGFRIVDIQVLFQFDTVETENMIRKFISMYQVPMSNVIVDDDGVGGGVTDHLGCKGFVNNSSPVVTTMVDKDGKLKADNFDNLKSQCYFALADKINSGKIYIKADLSAYHGQKKTVREYLVEELENVRQKEVDSDKKKGVMPKEKIKQKLKRSPDYSDAMMMRMYFELSPKPYYGVH